MVPAFQFVVHARYNPEQLTVLNIVPGLICIILTFSTLFVTTLSITHDIASARKISSRIAMLYKGKIVWHGLTSQMDSSGNPFVDQFIHGRAEGPIKMEIRG